MVAKWKYEVVENLKKLIESYKTIAIINIDKVPTRLLQEFREKYRGKILMKVAKSSLIEIALDKVKRNGKLKMLKNYLNGQVALLFTNEIDAINLYKIVESVKAREFIRGGRITPVDIVIPKGDLPIPPGPLMAEIQAAGIPVITIRGKVTLREDYVVARKGERVPVNIANILRKLDIKPIEVGLKLLAVYEDGYIYTPDVLRIDVEHLKNEILDAYNKALTLAVETCYPTKQSLEMLLRKIYNQAKLLALEICYIDKDTIRDLLSKAFLQAISLINVLPENVLDEKTIKFRTKKVEKEEKKKEKVEKKEEKPKEEEKSEEEEATAGLASLFG